MASPYSAVWNYRPETAVARGGRHAKAALTKLVRAQDASGNSVGLARDAWECNQASSAYNALAQSISLLCADAGINAHSATNNAKWALELLTNV